MYACSKVLSVYPPLRFGFGSWLFPPRSRSITSPLWRMNVGSSISNRSVSVVGMIFSRGYNRSEENTSELQSLMRITYAVFCLQKKNSNTIITTIMIRLLYSHNYNTHLYDR